MREVFAVGNGGEVQIDADEIRLKNGRDDHWVVIPHHAMYDVALLVAPGVIRIDVFFEVAGVDHVMSVWLKDAHEAAVLFDRLKRLVPDPVDTPDEGRTCAFHEGDCTVLTAELLGRDRTLGLPGRELRDGRSCKIKAPRGCVAALVNAMEVLNGSWARIGWFGVAILPVTLCLALFYWWILPVGLIAMCPLGLEPRRRRTVAAAFRHLLTAAELTRLRRDGFTTLQSVRLDGKDTELGIRFTRPPRVRPAETPPLAYRIVWWTLFATGCVVVVTCGVEGARAIDGPIGHRVGSFLVAALPLVLAGALCFMIWLFGFTRQKGGHRTSRRGAITCLVAWIAASCILCALSAPEPDRRDVGGSGVPQASHPGRDHAAVSMTANHQQRRRAGIRCNLMGGSRFAILGSARPRS